MSDPTQEEIKATDLVLLMGVVQAAAGLYNALELQYKWADLRPWAPEFNELGDALRTLGLREATDDEPS